MATLQPAPSEADGNGGAPGSRAGLIMRFAGTLRFIPLSSVLLVTLEPPVTAVPGTPFGVALVGEYVTAVLQLGPTTGQLVLCDVGGEPVSLTGVEVLASGTFAASAEGVCYADAAVPVMDVAEQLRQLKNGSSESVKRRENPEQPYG